MATREHPAGPEFQVQNSSWDQEIQVENSGTPAKLLSPKFVTGEPVNRGTGNPGCQQVPRKKYMKNCGDSSADLSEPSKISMNNKVRDIVFLENHGFPILYFLTNFYIF